MNLNIFTKSMEKPTQRKSFLLALWVVHACVILFSNFYDPNAILQAKSILSASFSFFFPGLSIVVTLPLLLGILIQGDNSKIKFNIICKTYLIAGVLFTFYAFISSAGSDGWGLLAYLNYTLPFFIFSLLVYYAAIHFPVRFLQTLSIVLLLISTIIFWKLLPNIRSAAAYNVPHAEFNMFFKNHLNLDERSNYCKSISSKSVKQECISLALSSVAESVSKVQGKVCLKTCYDDATFQSVVSQENLDFLCSSVKESGMKNNSYEYLCNQTLKSLDEDDKNNPKYEIVYQRQINEIKIFSNDSDSRIIEYCKTLYSVKNKFLNACLDYVNNHVITKSDQ